jgi:hypothetical protein
MHIQDSRLMTMPSLQKQNKKLDRISIVSL